MGRSAARREIDDGVLDYLKPVLTPEEEREMLEALEESYRVREDMESLWLLEREWADERDDDHYDDLDEVDTWLERGGDFFEWDWP